MFLGTNGAADADFALHPFDDGDQHDIHNAGAGGDQRDIADDGHANNKHANNNCPVMPEFNLPGVWEITFINKSMMKMDILSISDKQYPLPEMDFPNNPGKPDFHFSIS